MLKEFKEFAVKVNMVVRSFNKMKREEEGAPEPEAPPEPTAEETLPSEIRDILRPQARLGAAGSFTPGSDLPHRVFILICG